MFGFVMFVINSLFMTRCSMKHKALNEVKTSCLDKFKLLLFMLILIS